MKKVELQPIGWSLLSCLPQSWSRVSKLAGVLSGRWEPLCPGRDVEDVHVLQKAQLKPGGETSPLQESDLAAAAPRSWAGGHP